MKELILILAILLINVNQVFAQGLELSDVIKQAREAQMKEQAKEQIQKSIQPVKNEKVSDKNEKSAEEKISSDK